MRFSSKLIQVLLCRWKHNQNFWSGCGQKEQVFLPSFDTNHGPVQLLESKYFCSFFTFFRFALGDCPTIYRFSVSISSVANDTCPNCLTNETRACYRDQIRRGAAELFFPGFPCWLCHTVLSASYEYPSCRRKYIVLMQSLNWYTITFFSLNFSIFKRI